MIAKPFVFLSLFLIAACAPVAADDVETLEGLKVESIYWSDGDSGRINGDIKFRLANIDAPETGSMKQRGGAKCEKERELGFLAKAFMVELTRDDVLVVTADFGLDRYQRNVIYLEVDGINVGAAGVLAGHLAEWPHKGRRALKSKPDWCTAT